MERSLDFPEGVVAQEVAAQLDAMTLPSISEFTLHESKFSDLSDFTAFSAPIPELLSDQSQLSAQSPLPVLKSPSKVDVSRAVIDAALEALASLKRLEDRTAACKARLVAKIAAASQVEARALGLDTWQRSQSEISVAAQIAITLCVPARTAGTITRTAVELVESRQNTLSALEAGELSWRHAETIVDELSTLNQTTGSTPEELHNFESTLLKHAPGSTAHGFASKARRLREGHHPQTLLIRTRQAVAKREMTLEPSKDGMSWLTLHLPAVAAQGVWVQCTRMARAQQQQEGEHRTLTQLRVDSATAVLLGQKDVEGLLVAPTRPAQRTKTTGVGKLADADGKTAIHPSSGTTSKQKQAPWDDGYTRIDPLTENPANMSENDLAAGPTESTADGLPQDLPENRANRFTPGFEQGLVDGIEEDPVGEYLAMLQASQNGKAVAEPPLPTAQVIVTVPVMGLLGLTEQLAELTGHGPIPAAIARKLLGESKSFLRVLTDPITGVPLDLQPQTYRVGKRQRLLLAAMEQHCTFPNCNVPAILSETDHLQAFELGGKTTSGNLQPLCKQHHMLKHFKDDKDRHGIPRRINEPERKQIKLRGWKAQRTADNGIVWISPSGKVHRPPPHQSQEPLYPKQLAKHFRSLNSDDTAGNTSDGRSQRAPKGSVDHPERTKTMQAPSSKCFSPLARSDTAQTKRLP